ncbi:hypothetical protein J6590_058733, partial [Homalodisca vitripennis]
MFMPEGRKVKLVILQTPINEEVGPQEIHPFITQECLGGGVPHLPVDPRSTTTL